MRVTIRLPIAPLATRHHGRGVFTERRRSKGINGSRGLTLARAQRRFTMR
eukprot:CAMPEP_0174850592 /NCGR_PEP_ID=MMETSP1114-20130205/20237_1 /TAXON_ID=312471 /ORGANISM="Neobodo designis, Strain CCAP 1951/1" /LENGTH=49 /DNA_ID= /DNA_START= /DNA_END= /DNA_ORIENTATION=